MNKPTQTDETKIDRRTREWRLAHPRLAKKIGRYTGLVVKPVVLKAAMAGAAYAGNFCPNCAFPVKQFNSAMNMVRKKQGKFHANNCCNCGFPMDAFNTAMRLANKYGSKP